MSVFEWTNFARLHKVARMCFMTSLILTLNRILAVFSIYNSDLVEWYCFFGMDCKTN